MLLSKARFFLFFFCFLVVQGFAQQDEATKAYIRKYRKLAVREMKRANIPASITLAQGILESASGNSELAKKAKNHFGIKCAENWTGPSVKMDDDAPNECFRKYRRVKRSFRDHSAFLAKRKRYENLFKLERDDYKAWAYGLKEAGYATNPKYPQLLINLIERYELQDLDVKGALKRKLTEDSPGEPPMQKHQVQKGDTLYSIAKKYNTSVDKILRMNNRTSNTLTIGEELRVK